MAYGIIGPHPEVHARLSRISIKFFSITMNNLLEFFKYFMTQKEYNQYSVLVSNWGK